MQSFEGMNSETQNRINRIKNMNSKNSITGRVDSFGRISTDLIAGNPMSNWQAADKIRDLEAGQVIGMYDGAGAKVSATVTSVGTTIHTPGGGVSDYRNITLEG